MGSLPPSLTPKHPFTRTISGRKGEIEKGARERLHTHTQVQIFFFAGTFQEFARPTFSCCVFSTREEREKAVKMEFGYYNKLSDKQLS